MSSVRLTLVGGDTLARTLAAAGEQLEDLTGLHRDQGEATLRAATIPYRTGTLSRSSYVDADAQGFALSATAPYAGFVHARDPFFTRALDRRAEDILDALGDHAEDILDTIHGA